MMARRCRCPSGHELKLWVARAGACDGCRKFVADGEQVMDCRACNWYLCNECRPAYLAQASSFIDSLQNMVFGDMCLADPRGRVQATEIVVGPATRLLVEESEERIDSFAGISGVAVGKEPKAPMCEPANDEAETLSPPDSPSSRCDGDGRCDVFGVPAADLLDVNAEPEVVRPTVKAADPFDLSTVDFAATSAACPNAAGVGGA
eukprot:CAMPEP_0170224090 /NCGR_PEP_ID=MMETSP0116_2-20130129/11746_1 /TAXON_ID=400756 /ORGANISM="Durinskia baltica, Strain CSIRO CS-38" /LENGTH=204 /DNA_ID=CAMNT_0010474795 /DNA_START=60 /DNA_END=674 /DNA_ORIENTATION=+